VSQTCIHPTRVKFSRKSSLSSATRPSTPLRDVLSRTCMRWRSLTVGILGGSEGPLGRHAKTRRSCLSTNETREAERGVESTIEPPEIAAVQPVLLCHIPHTHRLHVVDDWLSLSLSLSRTAEQSHARFQTRGRALERESPQHPVSGSRGCVAGLPSLTRRRNLPCLN
jgi:hypothetical protein